MGGGCAPERWVSLIFRSPHQQVHPPLGGTPLLNKALWMKHWRDLQYLAAWHPPTARGQYKVPPSGGWSCCYGDRNIWDSPTAQGYTNCPRAMGAHAWWAGVDFPRVSNLLLRTSVWYSSNCIDLDRWSAQMSNGQYKDFIRTKRSVSIRAKCKVCVFVSLSRKLLERCVCSADSALHDGQLLNYACDS